MLFFTRHPIENSMSASDGPRRPQVDVVGKYSVSANTALEKRLLRCEVGLAVLALALVYVGLRKQ